MLALLYAVIWLGRWIGWYMEVVQLRTLLGLDTGPSPLKWQETAPYLPFILLLCDVLPLVLLAALCHELGHLGALTLAGVRAERLRLTAFGAELRADTRYLPYGVEILCTLAGPTVNLALAPLLARLCGDYLLAGANLLLGAFNLLPLANLDGGRALYLLTCWLTDPPFADRLCRYVSLACGLVLLGAAAAATVPMTMTQARARAVILFFI